MQMNEPNIEGVVSKDDTVNMIVRALAFSFGHAEKEIRRLAMECKRADLESKQFEEAHNKLGSELVIIQGERDDAVIAHRGSLEAVTELAMIKKELRDARAEIGQLLIGKSGDV
jgi:hypothetical protein